MTKILLLPLLAFALAGCFTSRPPEVAYWLVSGDPARVAKLSVKYPSVRLSQVILRTPYDGAALAVLRANDTVAFDAYNRFAASPSMLLKGPTIDLVRASGLFAGVVGPTSSVHTPDTLEVVYTRLALDCTGDRPQATMEVLLTLVDASRRAVVASSVGSASVPVADGNYGAGFSAALTQSLSDALSKL